MVRISARQCCMDWTNKWQLRCTTQVLIHMLWLQAFAEWHRCDLHVSTICMCAKHVRGGGAVSRPQKSISMQYGRKRAKSKSYTCQAYSIIRLTFSIWSAVCYYQLVQNIAKLYGLIYFQLSGHLKSCSFCFCGFHLAQEILPLGSLGQCASTVFRWANPCDTTVRRSSLDSVRFKKNIGSILFIFVVIVIMFWTCLDSPWFHDFFMSQNAPSCLPRQFGLFVGILMPNQFLRCNMVHYYICKLCMWYVQGLSTYVKHLSL